MNHLELSILVGNTHKYLFPSMEESRVIKDTKYWQPFKWRRSKNKDEPKIEENLIKEDHLRNEDNPKNENDLKYKD